VIFSQFPSQLHRDHRIDQQQKIRCGQVATHSAQPVRNVPPDCLAPLGVVRRICCLEGNVDNGSSVNAAGDAIEP
jgi:hypothetical protein